MAEPNREQKRRLRAHFGFTRAPFTKYMWASKMYDSTSQRELLSGLGMWLELVGIALVVGPSGVGKSITLRRFARELDEGRYRVIALSTLPSTPAGFLRSLSRELGLPMRLHTTDLFDQVRAALTERGKKGPHLVLVLDDAEGMRVSVIDTIRRLTAGNLDQDESFSIVLAGTDALLHTLQKHADLAPLRSRINFTWQLSPYGVEDTRNYVRYQLDRAEADPKVFTDEAIKHLFQASHGYPRSVNQLALQALIQAAIQGRDQIDGRFMAGVCKRHPLYQGTA